MSVATLLQIPEDDAGRTVFSFEHAMAHRTVMQVMGPLDHWSIMPYFIDPFIARPGPATKWPLNHQQAHDDLSQKLPAYPTAAEPGIPTSQNLVDSPVDTEGSRSWWIFQNNQEHMVAMDAILPLPLTTPPPPEPPPPPPASPVLPPWWALPPQLVWIFW